MISLAVSSFHVRALLLIALMLLSQNLAQAKPAFPVSFTDLAGREITITQMPKGIILGESRYLYALSVLNPQDPLSLVVGMTADLRQIDKGSYDLYLEKFPRLAKLPLIGHSSADSFSVEQALSLNADLAIFSVDGHGPSSRHQALIKQLEHAGVQVVFVDFRNQPIANTPLSMRVLGAALGRSQQAERFLSFYQQELNKVQSRLAEASGPAPRVFLHSRVGVMDLCCETMVRGMLASFIDYAHGDNIAKSLVPGAAGVLNLEYLLSAQPDVYIATAVGTVGKLAEGSELPYVLMGAGISEAQARASLRKSMLDAHLDSLQAYQQGRAFAIWHHFYNSPLNVAAVQAIAKWLYPERFADLHPEQTLQTLFSRFQSIPLQGVYWTQLGQAEHEH